MKAPVPKLYQHPYHEWNADGPSFQEPFKESLWTPFKGFPRTRSLKLRPLNLKGARVAPPGPSEALNLKLQFSNCKC